MQFILLNNPFTTGEYFKIASLVVPLVHSLLHPTTTSVSHSCWYYQVYGSKYNYLAIVISFQVEQPMLHVYLRHVYSKYRLISLKCSSVSYILFIILCIAGESILYIYIIELPLLHINVCCSYSQQAPLSSRIVKRSSVSEFDPSSGLIPTKC